MSDASADGERVGVADRVRIMRNGLFQNAATLLSSLIGMVIVPILLHGLGTESYGLWLTAIGVAALVGGFDLGLGTTITREVAAAERDAAAAPFVTAAGQVSLLLGLVGGLIVAGAGLVLRGWLQLDGAALRQAEWVFALTGAGLCADIISNYATAVLAGLQRYPILNALLIASVLLRAVGLVLLVHFHAGLVAIVGWQTLVAATTTLVEVTVVAATAPRFRLRLGLPRWAVLRARTGFALAIQLSSAAGTAMWRLPMVLIGILCGSSFVAPFFIAQRFPHVFEFVLWQTSDVLLPAVTAEAHDRAAVRDLLAVGTRWTLLLALPACTVMALLAPELLRAWIGSASPEAVLVLRITSLAVLVEGAGHAAEQVLWGAGRTRSALAACLLRALLSLTLAVFLIPRFGIVGAAIGLPIGLVIGAFVLLRAAAWHCDVGLGTVMVGALRGLLLPLALAGGAAWATARWLPIGGWLPVIGASLAAAIVYALGLRFGAVRPEERALARDLLQLPLALVRRLGRRRGAHRDSR